VSFSIRLAPGLRVRASSRGLRVSAGPRASRLHLGAGTPGISTGAGRFGYYHSLGGGTGRTRSIAARQRQLADASKHEQAEALLAAFQAILALHREAFVPAVAPVAEPSAPVDEHAIRDRHRRRERAGIGFFRRSARAEARRRADVAAAEEVASTHQAAADARVARQAQLDAWWQRLVTNDPDAVLEHLAAAFEDNDAPAAAVGVDGSEVSLAVLVPGLDTVPEGMPARTDAGNLSLRKLTKRDRNGYYLEVVAGYLLVTLREALAIAPGLTDARLVALRVAGADAYGSRRMEAVLAARVARRSLDGIRWDDATASEIVRDASTELLARQRGQAKELTALDLGDEPEIAQVVAIVEFDPTG